MRYPKSILLCTLACLLVVACQSDPSKKIQALEQSLAANYSETGLDSLLQAYEAAIKAHPDKHTENLKYLSRAAGLAFDRKQDPVKAVRYIHQALENHGANNALTEPAGLLARIWCAYLYKSTPGLSREPDDIDQAKADLLANLRWIDSALVQLDRQMTEAPGSNMKEKAAEFTQISEAYASLVEQSDPNKHVDLLMRAAGLAKSAGDPNKALRLYYSVAEKLPNHAKAPTALFMMAFIYETDLKDMNQAKATYERFLEKYPNDPDYADDAENALKFLGIPPEELIKQFQQNQQEQ